MSQTENDNASSELAAVLDRLRGEGELSSEGVFTVDLTKALPKLEKFQLPQPHFGLLKVIQSAVVSNATRINTSFSSGAIRIEHNGMAPHPSELREILSYLMSPDFPTHQRALRDLAIGVNTTLSRGGSWVEVSVKDGQEWVSQRWTKRDESEQLQQPHSDRSDMTTRFVMRRTASQVASRAWSLAKKDIFDLMEKNRDVMDEDSRAVFDRCRHAPVEITIEGKPLPESSFGRVVTKRWSLRTVKKHRRPNMMEIFLLTDVDSPHLLSPPVDSESHFKFYVPGVFKDGQWIPSGRATPFNKEIVAKKRCFGMIGVRSRAVAPGTVTFVKDGVDLTTLAPPLLTRGVSTILSAEGLPLDLSHFRIVEGPDVVERLEWLTSFVSQTLKTIVRKQHFAELEESERQHLLNLAQSH